MEYTGPSGARSGPSGSASENMNNDSTEGWEYLTTDNESADYHHIYEIMSQAMDGQWVCYGRSRGGRACVDYARHYQDDMKGFIPYVGVNCNGLNDTRIMDFLDKAVGDNAFGKEEAARRRKVVENFLVEYVKNRDHMIYVTDLFSLTCQRRVFARFSA